MPGSEAAVNGKYGTAVRRREDPPLIQGTGTYTDDVGAPGALHAHFVRSEVAHGRIVSIDTAAAAAAPGVAGVFTGADLDLGPFPPGPMAPDDMLRPTLARDVVRFQGEAIAVVVAETTAAAVDAAELVDVDIEPLEIVVDPERALDDDAPQLFPDKGSNLAFAGGSADEGALEGADVVVRSRYVNQRLAAVPMEPSAAVAVPDEETGGVRIWAPLQAPHTARDIFAGALGLEKDAVRVTVPNVGGGFGARIARLPRAGRGRGRRAAAGQAGALRREPLGDDDRDAARPRAGPGRRAGRAQRRDAGRDPRPRARRLRRLSRGRGDHALPHRPDGVGRLPHPAGGLRLSLRGDQHDADRRLPRSGAARGDRADRARDGPARGQARDGSRPSCGGATSSRPTTSRTRPSPAPPTTRASTSARSTACWRRPATTACAPSRRSGASAATCASSASACAPTSS